MVVHLGVIIIGVALAASMSYMRQAEFDLEQGQTARIAGHTVEFVDSRTVDLPNRVELIADIRIDGGQVYEPKLNRYRQSGQTVVTPSVRTGATNDVMLSIVRAPSTDDPTLGLRVTVQPLVLWLWVGGFVMAFGTLLAVFPGRRRNPLDPVSAPAPIEHDAPADDGVEPARGSADDEAVVEAASSVEDEATGEGHQDEVHEEEVSR
jgi:cytochrome c-type biogenesis protein CcmF